MANDGRKNAQTQEVYQDGHDGFLKEIIANFQRNANLKWKYGLKYEDWRSFEAELITSATKSPLWHTFSSITTFI